ncbi:CaiB/BaiF CoA transferase family protein [Devosia sp. Root635]|uniref:CaiB/BaiF CoA transferase family protein n=1 Tax=Devosia sp. Root635 TaxID=1736575 RepID=UPI0006F7D96E|nr:CoA transferase [Devosia sp. Root635]KRA43244.1 succinyl-CoA--benzylsuccinate CoA-transferase [Devosia sp. Root635]
MSALADLRIADFSWVGAGPRATKDLADNGATVIKIESRKRLDLGRMSPPFAGDPKDFDGSAFFAQTNTSKKSVTINLSDPKGIEIARKLVAWADVVVENFGPGFMDRIGLGYAVLKKIKPDIILASVSVAGKTGPMAGFRGYGNSAAAHSGHAWLTGEANNPPHMPPLAYGDVVAPMFLTVAILAALEHRSRTGEGQHLDVSQIEPMVHVIADLYAQDRAEKAGNDDPSCRVHGVFPTAGTDQWIAITAENNAQAEALKTSLGIAALDRETIAAATQGQDKFALFDKLSAAGVAAGPVLDGKDLSENPELLASGHYTKVEHPVLGLSSMPAPPYVFSETPGKIGPAPLLGQHNRDVYVDMLGLDGAEVDTLMREGSLA